MPRKTGKSKSSKSKRAKLRLDAPFDDAIKAALETPPPTTKKSGKQPRQDADQAEQA